MVDLRKRVESPAMCIESSTTSTTTTSTPAPAIAAGPRRCFPSVFPSIKFRLREERKRVIRMSKAKYHNIQDHETGMRRFCLIRNTLQRLQREAREEKLARHNARANNVSPSYLSASRPRSPSPPCDMEVADVLSAYGKPTSPIAALSDDEDEMPPCKRPRLFMEDDDDKENDKENSHEDRMIDVVGDKDEPRAIDDTQEILREVYESYTGESLSQSQPSPNTQPDSTYNTLCCSTNNICTNATFLLDSSTQPNSNGCVEWSRPQQQYPCSHSALMGNDLQSVVYQSLITSL